MIRIAVLGYKPLYVSYSGYEKPLANLLQLLNREDLQVRFFSFGSEDRHVEIQGHIEDVVKAPRYIEEGFGISRLLDFSSLLILGSRSALTAMNNSKKMLSKLLEYKPDIIIRWDFIISSLLEKYNRLADRRAKIISCTDGPWVIDASFNAIYNVFNKDRLSYKFLKYPLTFLRDRYLYEANYRYRKMVEISDALITTTNGDREIIRAYDPRVKAIFVIPPFFIKGLKKRSVREVTSIKRLAFIGSFYFWPNREASKMIEERIAPKLPDKRFIIAGTGAPRIKRGNIEYVGRVDDLNKFLDGIDVCLAPLFYGTGLKNKMVDYFASKRPVIGTSLAFAGYKAKNKVNAIIEDDVDRFVDRISELDRDKNMLKRIQKNSYGLIEGFSEEEIRRKWQRVINSVSQI